MISRYFAKIFSCWSFTWLFHQSWTKQVSWQLVNQSFFIIDSLQNIQFRCELGLIVLNSFLSTSINLAWVIFSYIIYHWNEIHILKLFQSVQNAESNYNTEKDRDLVTDEPEEKKMTRENIFGAGQSKRIWNELYKVIDSSDVIIQVLDVRDPLGTRCAMIIGRAITHRRCRRQPYWS